MIKDKGSLTFLVCYQTLKNPFNHFGNVFFILIFVETLHGFNVEIRIFFPPQHTKNNFIYPFRLSCSIVFIRSWKNK